MAKTRTLLLRQGMQTIASLDLGTAEPRGTQLDSADQMCSTWGKLRGKNLGKNQTGGVYAKGWTQSMRYGGLPSFLLDNR